jgi:hypothetical protein
MVSHTTIASRLLLTLLAAFSAALHPGDIEAKSAPKYQYLECYSPGDYASGSAFCEGYNGVAQTLAVRGTDEFTGSRLGKVRCSKFGFSVELYNGCTVVEGDGRCQTFQERVWKKIPSTGIVAQVSRLRCREPGPLLLVEPDPIDFRDQSLGNTDGVDYVARVSLDPLDTRTAINVTDVRILQGNSPFAIVGSSCTSPITESSPCFLNLRFKPTSEITFANDLRFSSNSIDNPQTFDLVATGTRGTVRELEVQPFELSFPDARVGGVAQSASEPIVLTNNGNRVIGLNSIVASGDFQVTQSSCGGQLLPLQRCEIRLAFLPTLEGERGGALTIANTATSVPLAVLLSGNATPLRFPLRASNSNLNFGQVAVSSARNRTIEVINDTANTASIGTLSIEPAAFSIADSSCRSSLGAGESCQVQLRFAPNTKSLVSGSLSVPSGASSTPLVISLVGEGVDARVGLQLFPPTIRLGPLNGPIFSFTNVLFISNSGTVDASVDQFTVVGEGMRYWGTTCESTLEAGRMCAAIVQIDTSEAKTYVGELTFRYLSDIVRVPISVETRYPPTSIGIFPPSLVFDPLDLGTNATKTISIRNLGDVPLRPIELTTFGGFSTARNTCLALVAPGDTCEIDVLFRGDAVGIARGKLTFSANTLSQSHSVPLTGIVNPAECPE